MISRLFSAWPTTLLKYPGGAQMGEMSSTECLRTNVRVQTLYIHCLEARQSIMNHQAILI